LFECVVKDDAANVLWKQSEMLSSKDLCIVT